MLNEVEQGVCPNAIPEALKRRKQWVCWRYEDRDDSGKPTKVPVTIGGYRASSKDPADWYSFDDCVNAAERQPFDGVGFVFTAGDHFVGIDLDDCLTDEGRCKPWAIDIVKKLEGTYSEVSPRGRGLKVFAIGPALDSGKKAKIDDGAIEIYSSGRFFTVTPIKLAGPLRGVPHEAEPFNRRPFLCTAPGNLGPSFSRTRPMSRWSPDRRIRILPPGVYLGSRPIAPSNR